MAGTKEKKGRWAAALMSFRKMIYSVVKAGGGREQDTEPCI